MIIASKIKGLLPSLREKKRYVAFRIHANKKIEDIKLISRQIHQAAVQFIGELGVSQAGIRVLTDKWDSNSMRGIIKVNHNFVNHLKASFTFISSIAKQDVIVQSIGVSGILDKAQKNYIS